jgi:ubiquinone biosynthesis accessory factor UbiK
MNPNSKFPQPAFINDLVGKLGEVLKQSPAKDIEHNLKAGVTSMLSKLDMVSREEFDVQTEVLARTRAKLEQLEARLLQLEKSGASETHLAELEKQQREAEE